MVRKKARRYPVNYQRSTYFGFEPKFFADFSRDALSGPFVRLNKTTSRHALTRKHFDIKSRLIVGRRGTRHLVILSLGSSNRGACRRAIYISIAPTHSRAYQ
jgi:hypothetical protein